MTNLKNVDAEDRILTVGLVGMYGLAFWAVGNGWAERLEVEVPASVYVLFGPVIAGWAWLAPKIRSRLGKGRAETQKEKGNELTPWQAARNTTLLLGAFCAAGLWAMGQAVVSGTVPKGSMLLITLYSLFVGFPGLVLYGRRLWALKKAGAA